MTDVTITPVRPWFDAALAAPPVLRMTSVVASASSVAGFRIEGAPRHPGEVEVVIPAYNEQLRIAATIRAFVDYFVDAGVDASVCVVDNGSIDRTADTVDSVADGRLPVSVVGCSRQGKGAAVRRGVLTSASRFVGFCDSDSATPAETLARILPLLRQGHPVVIGSRRCTGAHYVEHPPLVRRVGGWVFRSAAALAVPGVADTQCGFKFFQVDAARHLFSTAQLDGFAFDVELLRAAQLNGFEIIEVPVHWKAADGSTLRVRDGIRALADLRRIAHPIGPIARTRAAAFMHDG
jgi:glycosyltransferase involved in cell wall biosynthesis